MVWYPVVNQISEFNPDPGIPSIFGFIYTIDRIEIIEMMSHTFDLGRESRIRIDYESNEGRTGQLRRTEIGPLYFTGFGRINGPSQHASLRVPDRDFSFVRIPFNVPTFNIQPINDFVTDTIIG